MNWVMLIDDGVSDHFVGMHWINGVSEHLMAMQWINGVRHLMGDRVSGYSIMVHDSGYFSNMTLLIVSYDMQWLHAVIFMLIIMWDIMVRIIERL